MTSPGEFTAKVIDYVYLSDLHTDLTAPQNAAPQAQVFAQWLPVVGRPASVVGGLNGDEQLLTSVLGSSQYYLLQSDPAVGGLHTNNSWLTSLYTAMHVPFNSSGMNGQFPPEGVVLGNVNAAYAPTRAAAVNILLTSGEYRANFVNAQYQTLLGRGRPRVR